MRTKITLACTECQRRNYNMTKDKKTHPDRMETKKYCRFCRTHTMHKETDVYKRQFVYRIGLLEISVILITMIGSCIYANKGLRTLRNN